MEGLLTNYYEYHFLYITGIHHVESKNIQGVALMKLYFHPGTDMAQAMAETVGYVNRSRAFMPPGTVPPFVMRFDTGSVPVGYLVLSQRDQDASARSRTRRCSRCGRCSPACPGVSAPPPVRRQPAHHRRPRRPGPAAGLQHVARRGGHRAHRRQHHQPLRQRPHRRPDADRADQRHGREHVKELGNIPIRPGRPDGLPPRRRHRSRTPPTSRPATRWSTAGGRSTSWSPSGPTPRR